MRLERVGILAKKLGVRNVTVALAYLLNQPTPTFPIVGPVNVEETQSSLAALDIELSGTEVRWFTRIDRGSTSQVYRALVPLLLTTLRSLLDHGGQVR